MIVLVVQLHVLHAGEVLERRNQRLSDAVTRSARLAHAGKIDGDHAVDEVHSSIGHKAIARGYQPTGLLLLRWAFEVFVKRGRQWIG